jgi:predicted nucleic acid-binding protein
MAMYVVDTNVFSYLIKLKGNQLQKDADRARQYAGLLAGHEVVRAFPTDAELRVWVQGMEDGEKKDQYSRGVQEIMDQTPAIDGDDRVAKRWADIISTGRRLKKLHVHDGNNPKRDAQLNDTWIAACALAHGLTLVSDNRRDFEWMKAAVGLDLVCYSGA